MLKKLTFFDYKSFSHFEVSLRNHNVVVGPNNSGKSSTLDALRLAFDVIRFAAKRKPIIKSQSQHGVCSTYVVPQTAIGVDVRSCTKDFDAEQAKIVLELKSGVELVLKLDPEAPVEAYLVSPVTPQATTSFLTRQFPLSIVIVPTLSPLERNEALVQKGTVEVNQYSRLASRNFRSFWHYQPEEQFQKLNDLVARAWGGVRLMRPAVALEDGKAFVHILFRDGTKVREIQWAGFGFQVWMQTMTHLLRASDASVLVLDEPDIYLHPDLQHKLMKIIRATVGQYIVATHSTEIINGADPGDLLIIRPGSRSAKRIKSATDYGQISHYLEVLKTRSLLA